MQSNSNFNDLKNETILENKKLLDLLLQLKDRNNNKVFINKTENVFFDKNSKINNLSISEIIKTYKKLSLNNFWPKKGDLVGRCKIMNLCGKGFTSNVYRATHEFLNIEVAVKILSKNLGNGNQEIEEMFLQEAQNTAKLKHPNLVSIFDADKGEKYTYMVMEFIDGYDLEKYIEINGPLSYHSSIDIIIKICDALGYALENGIIHRDIKPGNIMVSMKGDVKLLDLGLSKIVSNSNNKEKGSILGTPVYMSPEQLIDSNEVDYRSDIYSLGATFYHMITGKFPFKTSSYREMITQKIMYDDFDAKLSGNIYSEALNKIINKLIKRNKNERYQSYDLLKKDLSSLYV